MSELQVPGWPVVELRLDEAGGGAVGSEPLHVEPGQSARDAGIARAAQTAARLGRPVRTRLTMPDGEVWLLAVDAEAAEEVLEPPATLSRRERRRRERSAAAPGTPAATAPAMSPVVQPPRPWQPEQPEQSSRLETNPLDAAAAHVLAAVDNDDLPAALTLAARWEADAGATLGPHAPGTVRAREARARLLSLTGDHVTACEIRLALARTAFNTLGAGHPDSWAALDRAQAAWHEVTEERAAARLGRELLRMRAAHPDRDAAGMADLRTRLARLRLTTREPRA